MTESKADKSTHAAIVAAKKAMRDRQRELLESQPEDVLRHRSDLACRQLMATDLFRNASVIMLYMPLAGEVDLTQAMLRCFQGHRTVCVPKVDWEHKRMWPVQISSFHDHALSNDRHGLRTPARGIPIPADMLDLIVVPGLAFGKDCTRLGRGGGFYDRFLSDPILAGRSVGLCFEFQVVDALPCAAHDKRLDHIVTDRRVITANPLVSGTRQT